MHTQLPSLRLIYVLSIFLCLSLGNLHADEHVLARVNDSVITADMMTVLQGSREQGPLSGLGQSQSKLLDSLITTELLFNEAKNVNLDTKKQIALELELAHKTLLSQFYVKHYMDQLSFDEAALQSAYIAKKPNTMVRMAYWFFDSEIAAHTFLSKVKTKQANTLPSAEELPWQALENYPFAELAEAQSLSDGEWLSVPVKDESGWLVWRCLEKSVIPKPSFEDAYDDIRQELATKSLHEHIARLRARAKVQTFLQAE